MQVLRVTFAGLALAAVIFFALTELGAFLIRENYMSPESVNRRKARIFSQFSAYVAAQGISGRDTAAVARWTASHDYVTIFLFDTGREQLYSGGKLESGAGNIYDPQIHGRLYPIRFSDGLYQVAVGDNSQVRQRQLVTVAAVVVAGISFLLLFMWYTGRLTRRTWSAASAPRGRMSSAPSPTPWTRCAAPSSTAWATRNAPGRRTPSLSPPSPTISARP